MASESGTSNTDLTEVASSESALTKPALPAESAVAQKLRQEPFRFDFFQAVRLLEKFLPDRTPVGRFAHPSSEVARFSVHNSLAFPASQIQSMAWPDDSAPNMTVNFMGLTGPQGTMPNPYTSLIIERVRASDGSLRDFLDIFNHRFISLFYRAWRKCRFDVSTEREERDRFSRHLLSLIGLGTDGLQERLAVPDDSLIYYSGLLSQRPRAAQALCQILADYFAVPVTIEQFAGGWYRLGADAKCQFAEATSDSECLGIGTVVGDEVWNQQSKIRLVLGPLSIEKYLEFLPDGSNWEPLRSWVRLFSNDELDFEVKLILEREQVPGCELGAEDASGPQLGWVSWLKSKPLGRDPDDTVLALELEEGVRT